MEKSQKKVLFLCTGNSCRSQMAEGFMREIGGGSFEALSAGMEPAEAVHPMAVAVMKERGIDISGQKPKPIETYLGKECIFYLIVVCEKAKMSCPRIWPGLGEGNRFYWPLPDPAEFRGSEEEKLEEFRKVRDEIESKVKEWLDGRP